MEIISSIYNSGYNIKKFYLGSQELNLAYLGNQVIYDEVIGDNDLNYILYEFYGSDTLPNTVEAPVKRAILKGKTDENLQSVKVSVLTTTGKNLFDSELEVGGLNSINGGNDDGQKDRIRTKSYIKVKPNTFYILSRTNYKGIWTVRYYDENYNHISPNSYNAYATMEIKTGANVHYIRMVDLTNDLSNLYQVEEGKQVTSYEPHKSNILTVNEDVTLRSNGDVYDELNLLTGRLIQRIDENNEVLAQAVVKTVDLTIVDQDGKTINKLNSFNGTTHVSTEVAENSIYPTIAIEVATE